MIHYVIELALLIFPAWFLGCFLGALAWNLKRRPPPSPHHRP